jgi:ankyrin repeat protein
MPTIDTFVEGIFSSAIYTRDVAVVRIMIQGGLNPDILITIRSGWPTYRYTPLQLAALGSNYDLAELLLESGADIHTLKPLCSSEFKFLGTTQTPLQLTAHSSSVEIAKLLIGRGAAVNVTHIRGASVLQNSIIARNLEITHLLLENRADIDTCFGKFGYPLTYAIKTGQMDLLDDLLKLSAQVNPTY